MRRQINTWLISVAVCATAWCNYCKTPYKTDGEAAACTAACHRKWMLQRQQNGKK